MDLGEANDDKGVVAVDLGPEGLVGEPRVLPLEARRSTRSTSATRRRTCRELQAALPGRGQTDLVNLHITYTAGTDSLEEVLRELEAIFPRWYARDWTEIDRSGPGAARRAGPGKGSETVREYVRHELIEPRRVRELPGRQRGVLVEPTDGSGASAELPGSTALGRPADPKLAMPARWSSA